MHSLWCTELYRLSIANMVTVFFSIYAFYLIQAFKEINYC